MEQTLIHAKARSALSVFAPLAAGQRHVRTVFDYKPYLARALNRKSVKIDSYFLNDVKNTVRTKSIAHIRLAFYLHGAPAA